MNKTILRTNHNLYKVRIHAPEQLRIFFQKIMYPLKSQEDLGTFANLPIGLRWLPIVILTGTVD